MADAVRTSVDLHCGDGVGPKIVTRRSFIIYVCNSGRDLCSSTEAIVPYC